MNRFTADFSSSIGSSVADTPPRSKDLFGGPELASTTPLAPPPSLHYGSSRLGTGGSKPLFQKSSPVSTRQAPIFDRQDPQTGYNGSSKPKSRLFQTTFNSSVGSSYPDDIQDEFSEDETFEQETEKDRSFASRSNVTSLMKFSTNSPRKSLARSTRVKPERNPSHLPRTGQPGLVPGFARDLGAKAKKAWIDRNDGLILDTEDALQQLFEEVHNSMIDDISLVDVNTEVNQLLEIWQRHIHPDPHNENSPPIGPPDSAPAVEKANYIASFLLSIRHPQSGQRGRPVATPKAILDWLNDRHVSYEPLYRNVTSHPINATASEMFWDAVLGLTLRGKLQDVMRLLAEADFKYAFTSVDDGAGEQGYRGSQLQTIQSIVYRARQILNACPAGLGNWETTSKDWEMYRELIQTELETMDQLAGRAPDEDDEDDDLFGGQNSEMDSPGRQSQNSRHLPWSVYRGIHTMMSMLMGSTEDIISQSQDWLEASCALTAWWDGSSDQQIAQWSADVSRASARSPDRGSDVDPYLGRLRDAFLCVTDSESKISLTVSSVSAVEVGLGCALEGNVQGVITILQTMSLCFTSAVAEVGSAAGWLNDGSKPASGFSSEDLMVLNYDAGKDSIVNKDNILQEYAGLLFGRQNLRNSTGESIEGWEMSLGVLRRMDKVERMRESITELLNQLDVADQRRAEKVINLCSDLGLVEEARKISERFGDHLVSNTSSYGLALLCYAKSHSSHKIQQLTDLLISYCLVQSRAYPTDDEMDAGLHSLVDTPRAAFADIAQVDPEAAAHLQFYMVGYACIRRFYSLRDATSKAAKLGLTARKRAATKALVAAINSAADSIYGGLYDSSRESAIQIDGLLTLLGEATALLAKNQDAGTYTSEQLYALLAAIEDLETVSERVYSAADDCMQAAMRNYSGSMPPSPRDMLKKSMSSGTNSNFQL